MQKFLNWTLERIREEDSSFSWMEEYRYEWAPLVRRAVEQILEGKSVLILTDDRFDWFARYITSNVNDLKKNRPLLPFYGLRSCFPSLRGMSSSQDLQLFEDMLEISYPNGYFVWYIGEGDHTCSKFAYRNDESFLWIMDTEVQDSFSLRSSDPSLDTKLLQLYKLFDATLSAALFGDLELE